jgi:hypothetical protein
MKSWCAPKRIEKFFGMAPVLVLVVAPGWVRAKGTNHLASAFASNCLRIARGKMRRLYSFPISKFVWRAE